MNRIVVIIVFLIAFSRITIGQSDKFCKEHDKELKNLIQFFDKNAYQHDKGVYLSEIDNTGKVVSDKVYTVALSRLIYGLSYTSYLDSSYLEKAKKSKDFLIKYLTAKDSKGYYFRSFYDTKSGSADSSQMLDIWQQSYGLCGLTELYRQQPDAKLLSFIHQLHNDFATRFHDSINGGFFGNYDLKKGAVAESKTLQSLMYPVTAYMENLWLADVANRKIYEPYLRENLEIAYKMAWNKDLGWVNLKFDDNWNLCKHESPEKPCFTVSPGHNFQFASLLLRTKDWFFLTDVERKKYKELGLEIIEKTLKKNIYPASNLTQGFYSLVNTLTNKILDDRKTWWQHCEALIALSLIESKFEKDLKELEQFYFSSFPDKKNGGEFFYIEKSNIPITTELKGSMGKSAYHSVEMVRFLSKISNQLIVGKPFQTVRISAEKRHFSSPAIEAKITEMQAVLQNNPELAWLFTNCFPNTLDTTVEFEMINGKPDTFVITGDIFAMWLRDSSAQVWPYLPFIAQDKNLQQLIAGVINRQTKCVLIDPYANAFNKNKEGSEWASDITAMKPELHERKWEVDGLCYVIRLAYGYWKFTGDISSFTSEWHKAMQLIVSTFKEQQRKTDNGPYRFLRKTAKASDTQFGNGYGNPMRPTGLICSMFRPSDDATTYPFLIPSNCFAVVSLRQLAEMERTIFRNTDFATECEQLATEVDAAIRKYGIVNHPKFGKIYAYEVDGFGNYLMMDDANVPSLLALPYLGYCKVSDRIYQNTRRFVWSVDNPYFYKGKIAEGIGGPHIGQDMVWPMSVIMKGLTSNNKTEIAECIRMLKSTHGGTGFMHESFNKDKPEEYTRSWFAWSNTLFGEFLIKVEKEYPELL